MDVSNLEKEFMADLLWIVLFIFLLCGSAVCDIYLFFLFAGKTIAIGKVLKVIE
jgi:hypothetical protein